MQQRRTAFVLLLLVGVACLTLLGGDALPELQGGRGRLALSDAAASVVPDAAASVVDDSSTFWFCQKENFRTLISSSLWFGPFCSLPAPSPVPASKLDP